MIGRFVNIAFVLAACGGASKSPAELATTRSANYSAQVMMDLRQFADLECGCADSHDAECSRKVNAERDDYYHKIDRSQPSSETDKASIDLEEKRFKDCSRRVGSAH